jgi:hypothetical protein
MKTDVLASILDGQKMVRRESHSYLFDEATALTVFAGTSGEMMSIPRVHRLDLQKEYCMLTTTRGERFYFPYELIVGLKLEEAEEKAKTPGGAGFR